MGNNIYVFWHGRKSVSQKKWRKTGLFYEKSRKIYEKSVLFLNANFWGLIKIRRGASSPPLEEYAIAGGG